MSRVLVPLAEGFEEIEAVSIIDVLRRGEIEVIVASLDKEKVVKGSNGVSILCDFELENIDTSELDMVVLPGGWGGTLALMEDERVQSLLQEMDKKKRLIGAICAAPMALNKAGVLKQNYTCYPTIEKQIREDGFSDSEMVVQDDNIMTSRGPATAICFALEIVKKLKGDDMYKDVKSGLLATYC